MFFDRFDPLHLILAGIVGIVFTLTSFSAAAQAPYKTEIRKVNQSVPISKVQPGTLGYSVPVSIRIPAINTESKIITVGQNSDGTLHVPENPNIAGWYKLSPTPGQTGPSVIAGHVDTKDGPAVFWRIGELAAGDEIQIARENGMTAYFTVLAVEKYDQNNFPTDKVYGNTDSAELRLITCGGKYNPFNNRYSHNTVVYARLRS